MHTLSHFYARSVIPFLEYNAYTAAAYDISAVWVCLYTAVCVLNLLPAANDFYFCCLHELNWPRTRVFSKKILSKIIQLTETLSNRLTGKKPSQNQMSQYKNVLNVVCKFLSKQFLSCVFEMELLLLSYSLSFTQLSLLYDAVSPTWFCSGFWTDNTLYAPMDIYESQIDFQIDLFGKELPKSRKKTKRNKTKQCSLALILKFQTI